jgi:hypothetical protein
MLSARHVFRLAVMLASKTSTQQAFRPVSFLAVTLSGQLSGLPSLCQESRLASQTAYTPSRQTADIPARWQSAKPDGWLDDMPACRLVITPA